MTKPKNTLAKRKNTSFICTRFEIILKSNKPIAKSIESIENKYENRKKWVN
jgi:hypothetical protein